MASEDVKKLLIVVSIFLIVFAAFFFLFWRTQSNNVAKYRIELGEKQKELAQLERDAEDWPDSITREKLSRYEEELKQLWTLIPSEEEVSMLLKEIETHAKSSDMEILSLSREVTSRSSRPVAAPAAGTEAAKPPRYVRASYKITLGGNYFGLITFLRKLENSTRLVTVSSTRIDAGTLEHIVNAEIQFNIFYSKMGVKTG